MPRNKRAFGRGKTSAARYRLLILLTILLGPFVIGAGRPAGAETLGSLVERCAPHVAPRTALAIIEVESGGNWYAVNDNDRAATPRFGSPEAAIAYARRRVSEGANIDIGLSQLNSSHLAGLGLTVDEAFEPCTNVRAGMGVLQSAWRAAQARWGVTRIALHRAFEAYNGGQGSWGARPALRVKVEHYADLVWSAALAMPAIGSANPTPVVHVSSAGTSEGYHVNVSEAPR